MNSNHKELLFEFNSHLKTSSQCSLSLAVFLFMAYSGAAILRLGWGTTVDFLIGGLGGWLLFFILQRMTHFGLKLIGLSAFNWLSWYAAGVATPLLVFRYTRFHWITAIPLTAIVGMAILLAGTAIVILIQHTGKRVIRTAILLILLSAGVIGLLLWILQPATSNDWSQSPLIVKKNSDLPTNPTELDKGLYSIKKWSYGSGHRHREEYGAGADWTTATIDGSPFLSSPKGRLSALREPYWGFDRTQLPLNATVWVPEGEGPFPVVAIVHGDYSMRLPSDTGYAYLGRLLASRGYLTLSIDETFLNIDWTGHYPEEMDARAWLLLEHLQLLRGWNENPGHPLYQKANLEEVALIGHSRGGEAIAIAAHFNGLDAFPENPSVKFDYHFGIQALIGLAPSDGLYQPLGKDIVLENVDYLLLHGAQDADVSQFYGDRQFQRILYTDRAFHFKSSLFIYRANHGQFNSVWADNDLFFPGSMLINKAALLTMPEQQQICSRYINAFLEASLKRKQQYLPLFKDYQYASHWLPDTWYINRYWDSHTSYLEDFEQVIQAAGQNAFGTSSPTPLTCLPRSAARRQAPLEMGEPGRRSTKNSSITFKMNSGIDGDSISATSVTTNGFPDREIRELPYRRSLARQNQVLYLEWEQAATLSIKIRDSLTWPKEYLTFALTSLRPEEQQNPLNFEIELEDLQGKKARVSLNEVLYPVPPFEISLTRYVLWEASYGKAYEPVLQTVSVPLEAFIKDNQLLAADSITAIHFHFQAETSGAIYLDEIGFGGK